jgi:hypothetical protein
MLLCTRPRLCLGVLKRSGWSRRRIARELGINRETVIRHLRLAKSAISTTALKILLKHCSLNAIHTLEPFYGRDLLAKRASKGRKSSRINPGIPATQNTLKVVVKDFGPAQ